MLIDMFLLLCCNVFVMLSVKFLLLCWMSCSCCYAECHVFVVMLSVMFLSLCWVSCFRCYAECHYARSRVSLYWVSSIWMLLFRVPCAAFICLYSKWVSWFKSILLLRIQIKYTNELQFLIKTEDSIFNRKVYTTDEKREPSMAWLGLIETDSILIKEKCKHLSKMSDRVSRKCFRAQALEVWV
jgi:hypothetical protein